MNTSTNNISFNGVFKVKKVPPRKKKVIEDLIAKKDAFTVNGFKEDKSIFVVVKPAFDNKVFETLKTLNLPYIYYPQIEPGMKNIRTRGELENKLNNLVAGESKILNIIKLLKIDMNKYYYSVDNNGKKWVINPENKDTLIISPIDKNGINYVEFYRGLSMSNRTSARRTAIKDSQILHEYDFVEESKKFKDKLNQTLIIEHN